MLEDTFRENIIEVREADGTPCQIEGHQMYTWDWTADAMEIIGDESLVNGMGVLPLVVQKTNPECITIDDTGFLLVDYQKLFGGE